MIDGISAETLLADRGYDTNQIIAYVETDFVKALKHGYLVEVQEPSTIIQPGVLVGLNSLLEQEGSITLPTGEIIRRHPDTVVIVTTNVSYEGCRQMNQSVVDRMSLVKDINLPEPEVMSDIIPQIGLPYPPYGRSNYNVPCPCCDDEPHAKHLNINLQKDVFRCPRCGFSGGIFDLYAYYTGIAREEVRDALIARLDVQGSIPKPEHIPMPVVAEVPPTDIASRSDTYTGLLSKLTLASDHRQNLRNRGLSDEEIDRLEYRTTPVVGMQTIARQLQSSGYYLSGVPGFYRKDGKWSFACESRGILIPVRDSKGRIQGMQIRRDNAARRKFRWVSSTGRTDGCKAEGWVHIAGKPRNMVLLTEGPMKADVIHYLTGQTVLAVAGVNSLTQLELILPQLHEQGVERIMTAFDMDFMENPHVQGGYRTLVSLLSDAGFRYGTYLWDPRYKGLDDYVWEHCFQRQLS